MSGQVLQPSGWLKPRGYSNGIVASGRMFFVAGQIGWNAKCEFESDDFVEQTAQALRNVVAVLFEGGAHPEDIVRMTWYVTDREEYLRLGTQIGHVYRDIIGKHYPVMTAIEVKGLMEARAKVEIEVTAVTPA